MKQLIFGASVLILVVLTRFSGVMYHVFTFLGYIGPAGDPSLTLRMTDRILRIRNKTF
jgi:hypothetical protein